MRHGEHKHTYTHTHRVKEILDRRRLDSAASSHQPATLKAAAYHIINMYKIEQDTKMRREGKNSRRYSHHRHRLRGFGLNTSLRRPETFNGSEHVRK